MCRRELNSPKAVCVVLVGLRRSKYSTIGSVGFAAIDVLPARRPGGVGIEGRADAAVAPTALVQSIIHDCPLDL